MSSLCAVATIWTAPAFAQQPSDEEIAARIKILVEMADPRSNEARESDLPYRDRYKNALMVDALAVGAPGFESIDFLLDHWEALAEHYYDNAFNAFSTTVSNGSENGEAVFTRLNVTRDWFENNGDKFVLATTVDQIRKAKQAGKVAVILNSQSMDMLDEDVGNVRKFWDLGVRQMNFTYNQDGPYSAGMASNAPFIEDKGVTELGKQVIAAMNGVGMIVDCSHSSNQTCIDAANLTTRPMIISHSNSMSLFGNLRNVSDEAMKAVASTGGAVCVNFLGGFLNPQGDATPKSIAKHIDYVKQLVGAQATCFGVDYVQNYEQALDPIIRNPTKYPPAQGYGLPTQMAPPADAWAVAKVLEEEHGWTDGEIRGLLGENVMRVYEANWEE